MDSIGKDNNIYCVILARASTGKQVIEGDTLEDQITQCSDFVKTKGWQVKKIFPLCESGRKEEREFFEGVLAYCKDSKNRIRYVVFKNISRFTRAGEEAYLGTKRELEKCGVEIRDIYGTIQAKVNTMEKYGLAYDWSVYSPSQAEETYQAKKSFDFVRDALTQMIGQEVSYTLYGYWNRSSCYGYDNQKIETEDMGVRNILVPNTIESKFIERMYEMRMAGNYSDKEIVDKLNSLGFKTRRYKKRDKMTKKVIGYGGEKKLTVKSFQSRIRRPIYCGVICERWTHHIPVMAKFKGIVDIDTFNKANRGKVFISMIGEKVDITYDKKPIQRTKNNPNFPFKNIVLCPLCRKPLLGSSPRSKSGKHIGYYHCQRGHKYWAVRRDVLHEKVNGFVKRLRFDNRFIQVFKEAVLDVWEEKRKEANKDAIDYGKRSVELRSRRQSIKEKLIAVESKEAIKLLEEELQSVDKELTDITTVRNKQEGKEKEISYLIQYAGYLMEHLEDLLICEGKAYQQEKIFGLLFEEFPTYEELLNGTPKLSPIFALNANSSISKSDLVTRPRLERGA